MPKTKIFVRILLVFIVIAIAAAGAVTWLLIYRYPLKYFDIISKYSQQYDLEPSFVSAVIHAESRFDKNAVSRAGASGLMQITEETAYWLAPKINLTDFSYDQIFDPDINIQLGCFYLDMLIKRYDDVENALCAYNAGGSNVERWLLNPDYSDDGLSLKYIPFPETRNYVIKVAERQGIYERIIKLHSIFAYR